MCLVVRVGIRTKRNSEGLLIVSCVSAMAAVLAFPNAGIPYGDGEGRRRAPHSGLLSSQVFARWMPARLNTNDVEN